MRHRRAPRPGRHGPGRRGPPHDRGAAPPRPRRRRRAPDRPGDARPHAAGDHRRGRRRPAARLRGRRGHRDRERRDLQPPRAARRARGGGPHLRHPLRLRGGGPRLRGARRGLRAPHERHLRLRPLGRARAAGWWPRATRSASSPSTGAATARRLALASEVGALLAAGLVEPRVDRMALDHYLACRFVPAPRTLFEGVSKLPPASLLVAERGRRAADPRATARRPASRWPASAATELAERAGGALHRRGRAPDDVRRALRRVPQSGASTPPPSPPRWRSAPRPPPPTFTIGFPGHGDVLDERDYAARVGARDRHRPHATPPWTQDRLPAPSSSAACAGSRSPAGSRRRRR